MNHLTPDELSAHLDGATTGAARQRAEAHLASCETCRSALAELAARDQALRSTLEHDPGDAYFETFAARVEDRIRARGLRGAQSRLGAGGWLGWTRSPRRLAWVGAVAAVVGGAAIVMLSSREIHRPVVNPALESKLSEVPLQKQQRAPQGARDEKSSTARLSPEEMTRLEQNLAQPSATKPTVGEQRKAEVGLLSRAQSEEEGTRAAPPAAEREAQSFARSSTPSDEAASGTAPARLQQSQRNASGEDVPVQRFAAPPPKAAVGSTSLKDAKRQAAPLQNAPSVDALAPLPAGQTRLCGRVVDPNGRPVSGAVVALADRGLTVSADAEGSFCMDVPEGLHELTAMAIGYESGRLQIHVEGETSQASVILRPVSVLGGGALAKKSTAPSFRLDQGTAQSVSPLKNPQSSHDRQVLDQAWAARDSATAQRTAAAYDAAAKAWGRVVPLAAPGAPQLQSRAIQAEMSYQAWKLGPTSNRANAARSAIDAYLHDAPAGAARDQALTWRRELSP